MQKRHIHLLVSFIIIIISLFYAFRGVKISELGEAFKSMRYFYLIPAMLTVILTYVLRAMRWRYLIRPVKEVRTLHLFPPLMIGFMANMMPARAGELVRAYYLSRKEDIRMSASFATIIIEKLFDLIFVLLLLVSVLFFMPEVFASGDADGTYQILNNAKLYGKLSGILCLLIIFYIALLQFKNDLAMKIIGIVVKPFPKKLREKIINLVNSFASGLEIIRDKRGFLASAILSFLILASILLTNYMLYYAFDIADKLPIISSLFVLYVMTAIFITVAPTPGFIGSFHSAYVASLHGIFLVQKSIALSFGIVAWFISMGLAVIIGAVFAIKENISFREFSSDREKLE